MDYAKLLLYQGADPCWTSTVCSLLVDTEDYTAFCNTMSQVDDDLRTVKAFVEKARTTGAYMNDVGLRPRIRYIEKLLNRIEGLQSRLITSCDDHGIKNSLADISRDMECLFQGVILPAIHQCLLLQDTLNFCAAHKIVNTQRVLVMQDDAEREAFLKLVHMAGVSSQRLLEANLHVLPSKLLKRVCLVNPLYNRIASGEKHDPNLGPLCQHKKGSPTESMPKALQREGGNVAVDTCFKSSCMEARARPRDVKAEVPEAGKRAEMSLVNMEKLWKSFVQSSMSEANKSADLQELLHSFGCDDRLLNQPDQTIHKRQAGKRFDQIAEDRKPFSQPRSTLHQVLKEEISTTSMEWVENLYRVMDRYFPMFAISKDVYCSSRPFEGKAQVVLVLLHDGIMNSWLEGCARFRELERQGVCLDLVSDACVDV